MRVLGYMSGTSLDGVDAAIIDTDGHEVRHFGPAAFTAFTDGERKTIGRAVELGLRWNGYGETPAIFIAASAALHDVHLRTAGKLLAANGGALDLVGFHGQTVLHRPERGLTIQIGDPDRLSQDLGVPVVAGMRHADMANGGQGAPLVPAYHAALAPRVAAGAGPVAFLNLGGVANVTWVGADGTLIAFDTGPACGLIDSLVQARGAGAYDADGALAARGKVDGAILDAMLGHPYFRQRPPKSLDRYDFSTSRVDPLSLEDAAATLTAFTVEAVALACEVFPRPPRTWVVCGGGRHNATMMRALALRLGDCRSADDFGLRGDFIEAEAMAFLAARSRLGLPLTFPGTTGVARAISGGTLSLPARAPEWL
ncbi:anhydro-N-acetylmuramic acid kinase [Stakelama tenebrarum]|uniref:Anhydro-N-acetylmuramic acid kinase n=1 Tax=Stakelama tenebrarum TaxID=2711215 RepID=A0A6G6Y5F7_9SPHN|nr:anhydro-N-acetylmuramic acid kinase [Sphingosinithalassobacter tenebrarum]QIG80184.1 anhydro-N-acetylmuramic acid kinase [Sphingosinithalassobacter tenebrarum]